MSEMVIVHSTTEADHYMSHLYKPERLLYTTSAAVTVYVGSKYGMKCPCVTEYVSLTEQQELLRQSGYLAGGLLKELDAMLGADLNSYFATGMAFFQPIYSYHAAIILASYLSLACALNSLLRITGISRILIYEQPSALPIKSKNMIPDFMEAYFSDVDYEIVSAPKIPRLKRLAYTSKRYKRYAMNPGAVLSYFLRRHSGSGLPKGCKRGQRYILAVSPLYELDFILNSTAPLPVVGFGEGIIPKSPGINDSEGLLRQVRATVNQLEQKIDHRGVRLLLRDIGFDFEICFSEVAANISCIKNTCEAHDFALAIWGLSPVFKRNALLVQYLQSRGIKVMGAQHGGNYGEQYYPGHFESDFDRCDYFLSYGFTNDDLNGLYPDRQYSTTVIPVGKSKQPAERKSRARVDLIYPLTNTISVFEGAMSRTNPQDLLERQMELLSYLNSLKGKKIIVKAVVDSNYDNCILPAQMSRFSNLKVVDHIMFSEALEKYAPRAVLFDFPSTPLTETISLDVEIFLMNDMVVPYSRKALQMLSKRVNYDCDTGNMVKMLQQFFDGTLQPKRNRDYLEHYVRQGDVRRNILDAIESLINMGNIEIG